MKTKDIIIIILVAAIAILGTYIFMQNRSENISPNRSKNIEVNSFEECVAAGNVVMESYPRQCVHNGKSFTEKVDNPPVPPIESGEGGKLIGGDRDENGCLIGGGYSWCAEKNKCLRNWEEACEEDKQEAIISAMADKYNKEDSEVSITISAEEGDYVRGGVEFAPGGLGNAGMFLATKVKGEWKVVYDGHGVADCDDLINTYGFPMEILTGICE